MEWAGSEVCWYLTILCANRWREQCTVLVTFARDITEPIYPVRPDAASSATVRVVSVMGI